MPKMSPEIRKELDILAKGDPFGPAREYYTGIPDPRLRATATAIMQDLCATIASQPDGALTKEFILGEFEKALVRLDEADIYDSEDREAAAFHLEAIMDIVGLESSDGLLNTWVYGFDPENFVQD